MGYEIEYKKVAFKVLDKYGDEVYFTYITQASNNVSPRIPRPAFFEAGRAWEIIQQACKVGADVESGMYKPKNRWSTPESYIRAWRKTLKEALPLEDLVRENPYARLEIAVLKERFQTYLNTAPAIKDKEYYHKRITNLIMGLACRDKKFFDDDIRVFEIPIKSFSDVEKYKDLLYCICNEGLLYYRSLEGV
jgi:hypothetical protein